MGCHQPSDVTMLLGFGLLSNGWCLCHAGRVKDYGETPVKRARLALQGYTWGCPTLPTAADLAGMDDIMVAAEAAMSHQAADLAPGTHVEYRSREPYLIGGWFRAKILQVFSAGMMSASIDNGRRVLLGLGCLILSLSFARQQHGQYLVVWCLCTYIEISLLYPLVLSFTLRGKLFSSFEKSFFSSTRKKRDCIDAVCHK